MHRFSYLGTTYELHFQGEQFREGCGLIIKRCTEGSIERVHSSLLLWLTVYFGEDLVTPNLVPDPIQTFSRGTFAFEPTFFDRFIRAAARFPGRSHAKWRQALFRRSLLYFRAAITAGFPFMPLNLGFFGMCLECIGNFYHGRRKDYFTLGDMRFLAIMRARLKRYKQKDSTKAQVRQFERRIIQDIQVVHALRNAYYGHSLLHKVQDRKELAFKLRALLGRQVRDARFVRASFPIRRLEDGITSSLPMLYKVGLRVCRLFIFHLLGFVRRLPFATHDFSVIGDFQMVTSRVSETIPNASGQRDGDGQDGSQEPESTAS
jgi:hypothetical protein